MPHLVILYTPDIEPALDMAGLCRALADTMLALRDQAGQQVFPTGGTRVLAYPATHHAVADGQGEYGFIYLNLRMGAGRSGAVHQQAGDTLMATVRERCAALLASRPVGITLQVDVSPGQVYDAKFSSLHPLFNKA
ncbi:MULTISPECIES: 5-carboxymethyl-2-hydroxymuconate isomerase [Ramlibacter]|uniref:5-carboxymethyl-2-hydroxymuconate isomerase n=1 Tax=Ramlibacter aquaticus TaxID=2780094 RepID=A0ABR9SIY1_9BURK|nr:MULTISPECIES: 5-carboxymethyl-2-hydroxymuconate isomerase [Ramlibacter]MBE7942323.1 5-carboxymethyl-2-hydroxymuconate isomerase [Ramlibacter aquaticus]